jgi:hypothetical protein
MYQQLWRYSVEEKLYLGVREQKRLRSSQLQTQRNKNKETLPQIYTEHCSRVVYTSVSYLRGLGFISGPGVRLS